MGSNDKNKLDEVVMSDDLDVHDPQEEPQNQSVGGFLLLYCILLTLLNPFMSAVNLVDNFRKASSDFGDYVEGLMGFFVINFLVRLLLVVYSIHAGMALWTVRPNAVQTAKTYLVVFLIGLAIAVVSLFAVPDWQNEEDIYALVPMALREVGFSLMFFAVGWLYLSKSKRVRALYGETEDLLRRPSDKDSGEEDLDEG